MRTLEPTTRPRELRLRGNHGNGDWLSLACVYVSHAGVDAVSEVLRSAWLSMGRSVLAFEDLVAEVTGAAHVVMTSSCTSATEVALRALGVEAGDEVIVPSFTWPSAVAAVCGCAAVPVVADVDRTTGDGPHPGGDRR